MTPNPRIPCLRCVSQILRCFQIEGLWQLCQASLLAPHFQQHLLTSHLCVTFWYFLQSFKLFQHYYICYGAVISDHWCCYFNCLRKQFTTNQVAVMVMYPPANAGDARDMGSVFGLGRTPGVGNCNLLQYSCLENPSDRGDWWATVHGVTKSWTWLKWLSTHTCMHFSRLNWNWQVEATFSELSRSLSWVTDQLFS